MEKGNFKVKCISDDYGWLIKGKIYEVKDGVFPYEGVHAGSISHYSNFSEFCSHNPHMGGKLVLLSEIPEYIIINQKSNTVTATLKQGKEVIKTKIAKCSPSDTFEFGIGAKLAVERLFGMDKINADWINVDEVETKKFRIGDRVRVVNDTGSNERVMGEIGTIKCFHDNGESATVEFDNPIGGHSGTMYIKDGKAGHCWYMYTCNLELVTTPPINRVSRQAKVGEWVEIVKTINGDSNAYLPGDICKVVDTKKGYGIYASTRGTHSCNVGQNTSYLYGDEYIVLENYNPSTTTPSEPTPPQIDYSEIDYTKLDGQRLFEEVKRRVRENG